MNIEERISAILEDADKRPLFEMRPITGDIAADRQNTVMIWRDGRVYGLSGLIITNRFGALLRSLIALIKQIQGEPHV